MTQIRTMTGLIVVSALSAALLAAAPPSAFSTEGMVASDHRLVSQAGADVLRRGGNAVDAAVASALVAGVVQPAGSGLGGGGFAVLRSAKESLVLDFREQAPAASTQDMYTQAKKGASRTGGLAIAVPGESPGLIELHRRFGSLSLAKLARPAQKLAQKGFRVTAHLHKAFSKLGEREEAFLSTFIGADARPAIGSHLRRPRLAKALKDWARTGGAAMTTGWVAKDIVRSANAAGGILSLEDMSANQPRVRDAVTGTYRGWSVISMPPPSSGGIVLMQVLSVLEGYDLASLGHNSSALFHLYAEAFQHAFADRANHLGDPDRISIPQQSLLSPERVLEIRKSFDIDKTLEASSYGTAIDIGNDEGTQHISIIDENGLAVSLTTTINTYFGSKVVAEKSGIVLNNEMDDFVAQPGVPNAYGLIGSEANSVAPGAVPLSSMSPTILQAPDGTTISIGASGGPFIISSTVQAIINLIDFGLSPAEAVSRPRMHHQWAPRTLFVDTGTPIDVIHSLEAKGHTVKSFNFYSSVQVVRCKNDCQGASDPRKGGWPAPAMEQ